MSDVRDPAVPVAMNDRLIRASRLEIVVTDERHIAVFRCVLRRNRSRPPRRLHVDPHLHEPVDAHARRGLDLRGDIPLHDVQVRVAVEHRRRQRLRRGRQSLGYHPPMIPLTTVGSSRETAR